jgi:hypothetical protein
MVIDKNKIGYTIAKLGGLGIFIVIACFAIFTGYTTWGILVLCVGAIIGGLMVTDCWDNM